MESIRERERKTSLKYVNQIVNFFEGLSTVNTKEIIG